MNSGTKKFTRSGKKSGGDDYAGNFVFNFTGNVGQSFKLGDGDAILSGPTGTSGGFGTAGSPSSSPSFQYLKTSSPPSALSSHKDVFVFGAGSASATLTHSPNAALRRSLTDITPKSPSTESPKDFRRVVSDFNTLTSPFSFKTGTNTNANANTPLTSGSTFSFRTQNSTTASTAPSNSTTPSTATAPPVTATATVGISTLIFGKPSNTTTPEPASTTSAFSVSSLSGHSTTLARPPTTSAGTSTFSFGKPSNIITPKLASTTSTFSIGGGSTLSNQSTTIAAPVSASAPSTTPISAAGTPLFSFGTATTSQKTNTSAASTTTSSIPSLSTPSTASSTTSSSSASPSANLFGGKSSLAAPTLKFGSSTDTTSVSGKKDDSTKKYDTPASLFSFGSITTTTAPTTSSAATTAATSSSVLPSFSAKPAPTPAISHAPNAYTFSTILTNLLTAANETPSQFRAALVTPSANVSRQNQIVTHTNFRIDNILPTTRYTELPEQAKKELDELDQYIHGESHRCHYLVKHVIPKQHESIKQAKHDQEMLSYRLGSLSSSLQMQVNAVEELFDWLKHQIWHFNYGQTVIDAGAPSSNRLHAYDDYFVHLSTQLTTWLEGYKKCIQEIEFTTDSWTKNKAQAPQDIARVMESQNQTFLALTNQVAALHEQLQMEQDLFTQHRLQSIAL